MSFYLPSTETVPPPTPHPIESMCIYIYIYIYVIVNISKASLTRRPLAPLLGQGLAAGAVEGHAQGVVQAVARAGPGSGDRSTARDTRQIFQVPTNTAPNCHNLTNMGVSFVRGPKHDALSGSQRHAHVL